MFSTGKRGAIFIAWSSKTCSMFEFREMFKIETFFHNLKVYELIGIKNSVRDRGCSIYIKQWCAIFFPSRARVGVKIESRVKNFRNIEFFPKIPQNLMQISTF
jgi:hypothetical protein